MMRVCLIYDHVFPQTVGGAERWMRDLALCLAAAGHEVTYLTMRHSDAGTSAAMPGVHVIGLTAAGRVYREDRRTLGPPLRFGAAVARHLLRNRRAYDVVHTASFPYFPLLAAGALRRRNGYELVVDWHEVWTREYWRHYAGRLAGTLGWLVQRACIRLRCRAHCMSQLHADRLVAEGYRATPIVLPGLYAGPVQPTSESQVDPDLVVYAGRQVKEKRIDALMRGFEHARRNRPALRLDLYGDGPDFQRLESVVRDLDASSSIRLLGHRPEEEVADAIARAACVATASEREGYGLIVVEAAARGTPSVIVAGAENAATELVQDGLNGAVAASVSPQDIANALLRVLDRGTELRVSTARWFAENASTLTLARSLEVILASYAGSDVG